MTMYLRGMRLMVVLAALVTPSVALAQATTVPSESDKTWTQVQQNAAEAESAQDCAIACRALESLSRATQHLCDLGPEHCDEARAKLREATERVRAACPECAAVRGAQPEARMATAPPSAGGGSADRAVAAESTQRGGGCAGCSASPTGGDLVVPGLAALALLASRKKKRRRL